MIKNLSDKGLSIYENGKEKFSYKVNQFCKRLAQDAFIPNSKEYLWSKTTSNALIPQSSQSAFITFKDKVPHLHSCPGFMFFCILHYKRNR